MKAKTHQLGELSLQRRTSEPRDVTTPDVAATWRPYTRPGVGGSERRGFRSRHCSSTVHCLLGLILIQSNIKISNSIPERSEGHPGAKPHDPPGFDKTWNLRIVSYDNRGSSRSYSHLKTSRYARSRKPRSEMRLCLMAVDETVA